LERDTPQRYQGDPSVASNQTLLIDDRSMIERARSVRFYG
jgi:hypothetical protein